MKKLFAKTAMLGIAAVAMIIAVTPANAEKAGSSIEYHGGKKSHDRKIEKAAIRRAAEKIGDLRGSLEGFKDGYIVLETELDGPQSGRLGFPIIREERADRDIITGSVPIL